MKKCHIVLSSLLVLCLAIVVPANTTFAQVEELSLEELTHKASTILIGKVIGFSSRWNDEQTLILTDVTISVSEYIKGDEGPQITIAVPGGTVGDLHLEVSDTPTFAIGQEVLLFLKEDYFRVVGWRQGKYTLKDNMILEKGLPVERFISKIREAMASSGCPSCPNQSTSERGKSSCLVWLTPPCGEAPEGMSPGALPGFYLEQAWAQLEKVLPILAALKAEGVVTEFRPLPEASAIHVTANGEALALLETLPGVVRITPDTAESVEAARQFFRDAITQAELLGTQGEVQMATTNPSVNVYETWDYVSGQTDANVSVSVVLKDSYGRTKATATTIANSTGWYWVSFWQVGIVPGDTVEVTAVGNTVIVYVEALTATVNHITEVVSGTAPPSRSLKVEIWQQPRCDWEYYSQDISSDSTGNFSASFVGTADIVRGAEADIWCYDANGNATIITRFAHIVSIENLYDWVSGWTSPNASVTAVLKDSGGHVKETRTTTAYDNGSYFVWFSTDMVVGDSVEVTTAGEMMVVQVVDLTAKVDAGTDTVFGIGPFAGAQLKVRACHLGLPYG